MISIGNDIIALNSINTQRTNDKRFYSKILSTAEEEGYVSNDMSLLSFEQYVWLLWSVKESVYKFSKRLFPGLLFSPKKIIVELFSVPSSTFVESFGTGKIESSTLKEEICYCCRAYTENSTYYSRSIIYQEIIYTIVNDADDFDSIIWGIQYIDDAHPDFQSGSVRAFVLEKCKTEWPGAAYCVGKNLVGYPILNRDKSEMDIPLSFTHDDRYVAYAMNCFE